MTSVRINEEMGRLNFVGIAVRELCKKENLLTEEEKKELQELIKTFPRITRILMNLFDRTHRVEFQL